MSFLVRHALRSVGCTHGCQFYYGFFVGVATDAAIKASTYLVVAKKLGGILPENDIIERRFFLLYLVPIAVSAVNCDSPCQAGRARSAQSEIGLLDQPCTENNLIDIGHFKL